MRGGRAGDRRALVRGVAGAGSRRRLNFTVSEKEGRYRVLSIGVTLWILAGSLSCSLPGIGRRANVAQGDKFGSTRGLLIRQDVTVALTRAVTAFADRPEVGFARGRDVEVLARAVGGSAALGERVGRNSHGGCGRVSVEMPTRLRPWDAGLGGRSRAGDTSGRGVIV